MVNENTECDGSEMAKAEPIVLTTKNLREILDTGRKLVILILQHDPNVERAFKMQRDIDQCLAPYEKLYKTLSRKQSLMTDFITKKPRSETGSEGGGGGATENVSDTVAKVDSIEVTVEPDMTLMVSSDDDSN